jgi:hypothetical protein
LRSGFSLGPVRCGMERMPLADLWAYYLSCAEPDAAGIGLGLDGVGREMWKYHLSCTQPECKVSAMTSVGNGDGPVLQARAAGWIKHKTTGWKGSTCPNHAWLH